MDNQHSAATNPTDLPLAGAVLRLIADARDEAARRQHEYVGTEHLVLALARQGANATILHALAIEPQRVYTLISEIVQRGSVALDRNVERPFTSRTERAFSLAAESAQELGHTHIDVPHLLVGLLREQGNIGAQVLAGEGLTVERAYDYARHDGPRG